MDKALIIEEDASISTSPKITDDAMMNATLLLMRQDSQSMQY